MSEEYKLSRRTLLTSLSAAICAPAIVKFDNLMPVKSLIYERAFCAYFPGMDLIQARIIAAREFRLMPRDVIALDPQKLRRAFDLPIMRPKVGETLMCGTRLMDFPIDKMEKLYG